jgi:NADPH:quinone reductase-like Zn-dependent oxidoreductase
MAAPSLPSRQMRVVATRFAGTDEEVTKAIAVERDAPMPRPQPGQLLIRITARPIHPADLMLVKVRADEASDA